MTTNLFFTSKEQYLNFKANWAYAVNNKEIATQLHPVHFMLYNILRGKKIQRGFSPAIKQGKIDGQCRRFAALYRAMDKFRYWVRGYELHVNGPRSQTATMFKQYLLLPFGDSVSIETLIELAKKLPLAKEVAEGIETDAEEALVKRTKEREDRKEQMKQAFKNWQGDCVELLD